MPKVSVIVPVYNTELYVERAMVSLMEQTLDDVQIIIIDDGSKDNSLNIIKQVIDRYPARQRLVTLISRENRGVAATRAQGMELASGDYVIHLDSDDWVELNWLEVMYTSAVKENADVVVCDYRSVYAAKSAHIKQPIGQDGIECVKKLLEGELHGATWNKLVRRSLIEDHKLTFLHGINYLEDFILVIQIFLVANVINYISLPLVNYNQANLSSITATVNEQKVKEISVAIERISLILNDNQLEDKFECEVNIMKLKLKYWLLCCTKKDIPIYISGLFPETSGYILRANLSVHVKMVLFIAHHNPFLVRVIMRAFHVLKNIVS